MDQLHQEGVLEYPWTPDPREQSITDLVAEMQSGYFDGVRDPLAYITAHTDFIKARTLTERMNTLADELENWEQVSLHYVTDFFTCLNELHETGKVPNPFFHESRTETESIFLSYMKEGHFDSFRHVLDDTEEKVQSPALSELRERLEKLNDKWDAALVFKIEPYFADGSFSGRNFIQAYTKQDDQLIPYTAVFSGTADECQRVLAGLEAGTITFRQMRQPGFEPPVAPEQKYVYKMDTDTLKVNADDQHFIQAYEMTEEQTLIPGPVLFVGTADMCAGLLEQLQNGTLQQDDFFTVSAARISCYTTKDGAELDAFVAPDDKVYLGRRDHYDNRGHYLNNDHSLIHISDNERVFNAISGIDIPYTQDKLLKMGYFTQEEFERFTALQLNEPQTEKEDFSQKHEIFLDTTLDEYPLPDTSLIRNELAELGYSGGDLLPLSRERAAELLDQDMTIYAVQTGENPEMVFDRDDLMEQPEGILFAVPREEWETSPAFHQAIVERLDHQEKREQDFLNHSGDCFAIYQVKDGDEQIPLHYISMERLKEKGLSADRSNYDLVYTAPLPPAPNINTALDDLWEKFNLHHPADYHRPSMSVSDIIALKRDGVISCHYCDSVGFQQLPDFIKPENPLKNAEMTVEDDLSMIDGIINNGSKATVAELEQQARNGQPISLMDLADAVHSERGEKKSVLTKLNAKLPKQERKKSAPKKSAERER
ncbi:MAG: DUF4316 domain-containing protein [Oscillospiraceae bacterium]|nr:DUF4316 domain-containing protein [Oscillospiraceae bacterium]